METDILKRVYRLKSNIITIPFQDQGLQVFAYGREFILQGQIAKILIPCLLKLLDGKATVSEVCQKVISQLGTEISQDVIVQTIQTLEKQSLIREKFPQSDEASFTNASFQDQLDFFSLFDKNGHLYQQRLQQGHIGLFTIGDIADPMLRSLKPLGIGKISIFTYNSGLGEPLESNCLHQTIDKLEEQYLESLVLERKITYIAGASTGITHQFWNNLNKIAIKYKIPMTRVEVGTLNAEIGPTVLPGRTACYHCFELRKQSLKVHYEEYQNLSAYLQKHESLPSFTVHPLFREMSASMASYEIMRAMSRYFYPQTYNQVLSLNFLTLDLEKNSVLKIPRCPVCSTIVTKPVKEKYERAYAGDNI